MSYQPGFGQKTTVRRIRPLTGARGSHGAVYISEKVKTESDGTESSITRCIEIPKRPYDPEIAAEYSAITSDLLRMIDLDIFPKSRVLTTQVSDRTTHETKRVVRGVISSAIDDYRDINTYLRGYRADPAGLTNILSSPEHKRQLAALFAGCFFVAENDLHNGNWGLDKSLNLKKIDHDQSLFDLTYDLVGHAPRMLRDDNLKKWPNGLYHREHSFPITTFDIENLPSPTMIRPANWPSNNSPHLQVFFDTIKNDSEFKQWKWLYFTKLLLINENQIDNLCKAHSVRYPQSLDSTIEHESIPILAVAEHIKERQNQLKSALLHCPEYQDFLKNLNTNSSLKKALADDLEKYDKQFKAKADHKDAVTGESIAKGQVKPKYADRLFTAEENYSVFVDTKLKTLLEDAAKISDKRIILNKIRELKEAVRNEKISMMCLISEDEDDINLDNFPSPEVQSELLKRMQDTGFPYTAEAFTRCQNNITSYEEKIKIYLEQLISLHKSDEPQATSTSMQSSDRTYQTELRKQRDNLHKELANLKSLIHTRHTICTDKINHIKSLFAIPDDVKPKVDLNTRELVFVDSKGELYDLKLKHPIKYTRNRKVFKEARREFLDSYFIAVSYKSEQKKLLAQLHGIEGLINPAPPLRHLQLARELPPGSSPDDSSPSRPVQTKARPAREAGEADDAEPAPEPPTLGPAPGTRGSP